MRELSVAEQRYLAVLAVIAEGHEVTAVAQHWGVTRQTVHTGSARYERGGVEVMGYRPHRPTICPHQMPALIEVTARDAAPQALLGAAG